MSVNGSGDVIIGYSESNGVKAVDQRVVGRFASDTAGTFQPPVVIATGAGEYDDFFADNPERWGDYSAAVVDPDDDETFWVSNEIAETAATAGGNDADWGTRIARRGPVTRPQPQACRTGEAQSTGSSAASAVRSLAMRAYSSYRC